MNVKIKRLEETAVIPKYAKEGDAGLDLTAVSAAYDFENAQVTFGTGLAIEIPKGYVGLIFPRSSIYKVGLALSNAVGVIDSGYRGEIKLIFDNLTGGTGYKVGERVAQLMILPYPEIILEEVEELGQTQRGETGFGSSGR